jgi:hypothetical protein
VAPVPDPLLFRKSGRAGNRTRNLWICSQELWSLDHRGGRKVLNAYLVKHQDIKTYDGVKSLASLIFNIDNWWRWEVSFTPLPLYRRRISPVTLCIEGNVGHRADLNAVKRKALAPARVEPRFFCLPVCSPIVVSTDLVRLPKVVRTWIKLNNVRFEVFTAVTMKNAVFWDVALCRSCVNRRFGGPTRSLQSPAHAGFSFQILLPWRWIRYVSPKRRFTQDLQGPTSQKTAFFKLNNGLTFTE